jgi:hypothetical protein
MQELKLENVTLDLSEENGDLRIGLPNRSVLLKDQSAGKIIPVLETRQRSKAFRDFTLCNNDNLEGGSRQNLGPSKVRIHPANYHIVAISPLKSLFSTL